VGFANTGIIPATIVGAVVGPSVEVDIGASVGADIGAGVGISLRYRPDSGPARSDGQPECWLVDPSTPAFAAARPAAPCAGSSPEAECNAS